MKVGTEYASIRKETSFQPNIESTLNLNFFIKSTLKDLDAA